jgi:hypothetical protein
MEHAPAQKDQEDDSAQMTKQSFQADDPLSPFNGSVRRKWSVTLIACYVTFIIGFNATALTAAVSQTNLTFNISDIAFPHSVWPVTAWNAGGALL